MNVDGALGAPDSGSPCLDIGSPMNGTGSIVTQSDPGAATNPPPRFYRVRLVL